MTHISKTTPALRFRDEMIRTIDSKERIGIPPEFLKTGAGDLLFMRHPAKPCVIAYYEAQQPAQLSDHFLTASFTRAAHPDSTRRVLLSPTERQHLSITEGGHSLVFVGKETHFEIWTPQNWAVEKQALAARLAACLKTLP